MKKFVIFLLLGGFSLYGFSAPPIDPPKKTGDKDKTVAPVIPVCTDNAPEILLSSPNQHEEYTESRSVVDVTAIVTIKDCADYDCSLPGPNCSCEICVYDNSNCSGIPLGCSDEEWDPENCTYSFHIQADEGAWLWTSFSCHNCSYGNGCKKSDGTVPLGGGDVTFSDLEACPY